MQGKANQCGVLRRGPLSPHRVDPGSGPQQPSAGGNIDTRASLCSPLGAYEREEITQARLERAHYRADYSQIIFYFYTTDVHHHHGTIFRANY